jgi:hypothetical protein
MTDTASFFKLLASKIDQLLHHNNFVDLFHREFPRLHAAILIDYAGQALRSVGVGAMLVEC